MITQGRTQTSGLLEFLRALEMVGQVFVMVGTVVYRIAELLYRLVSS